MDYVITFSDVMAGVITLGLGVITFFIKGWFNNLKSSTEDIKKQIKENDDKVNKRIDKLEEETDRDIANIKQELKQRMAERDADEEVQKALKTGKITAAQSEWAKSYALKDMEGFKGFVDKAPVVVPQGKLDLKDAPAASNSDEVDIAILKNMGVSMEDVKKYNKKED